MKKKLWLAAGSIILLLLTAALGWELLLPRQAAVLTYHCLAEEAPADNSAWMYVRPADFTAQIDALREAGYEFVFADQLYQGRGQRVAITWDDGYADYYDALLPIIQERQVRVTIFVVVELLDKPGYLSWAQLWELADSGYVRIGSHGLTHAHLGALSLGQCWRELRQSRQQLEAGLGQPVRALAYPYGEAGWATTALTSLCYRLAFATSHPSFPELRHHLYRQTVPRDLSAEELLTLLAN